MLYLIKLDSVYKIGYSKNIEGRIKQLSSTHIDIELISTKFGNKKDEKELHQLCKDFKIKNELFEINKEVDKIFNTYISKYLQSDVISFNQQYKKLKEINDNMTIVLENAQRVLKLLSNN